jgi:hypothetical protein
MAADYCQARELAEVVTLLNGMWSGDPIEPCREESVFDVDVHHVLGLRAQLCTSHQRETEARYPGVRSVKIRHSATT